jgi:adenylosuccinate synthase
MVKEAILLNSISRLAVTKLDVLDGLESIKICTAYKYKGKLFKDFPYDLEVLENALPVYKEMPGWSTYINKIRHYRNLPSKAKAYLSHLEEILKVKISIVSLGSSREETIFI